MKTLIQRSNGDYWAGQNTWTQLAETAYRFSSSIAALNFIALNRLSSVRLVFKFDNPLYDIHLPVSETKVGNVFPLGRWGGASEC